MHMQNSDFGKILIPVTISLKKDIKKSLDWLNPDDYDVYVHEDHFPYSFSRNTISELRRYIKEDILESLIYTVEEELVKQPHMIKCCWEGHVKETIKLVVTGNHKLVTDKKDEQVAETHS